MENEGGDVLFHRRDPAAASLFSNSQHCRWLGTSFGNARSALSFEIDAVVLLPDHLHVLLRPLDRVDYSKLWRTIKSMFTARVLSARDAETRTVQQEDFDGENDATICTLQ
jgi:REP element-mobilizing transposase RayT